MNININTMTERISEPDRQILTERQNYADSPRKAMLRVNPRLKPQL